MKQDLVSSKFNIHGSLPVQ